MVFNQIERIESVEHLRCRADECGNVHHLFCTRHCAHVQVHLHLYMYTYEIDISGLSIHEYSAQLGATSGNNKSRDYTDNQKKAVRARKCLLLMESICALMRFVSHLLSTWNTFHLLLMLSFFFTLYTLNRAEGVNASSGISLKYGNRCAFNRKTSPYTVPARGFQTWLVVHIVQRCLTLIEVGAHSGYVFSYFNEHHFRTKLATWGHVGKD